MLWGYNGEVSDMHAGDGQALATIHLVVHVQAIARLQPGKLRVTTGHMRGLLTMSREASFPQGIEAV
jgi:hypothetical protein